MISTRGPGVEPLLGQADDLLGSLEGGVAEVPFHMRMLV
jgi:hypothetical protein